MPRFKLHHLFALSLLVSALGDRPAQAMGVNFDLDSPSPKPSVTTNKATLEHPPIAPLNVAAASPGLPTYQALPIPPEASNPPTNQTSTKTPLPQNVIASTRILTPPPMEALPTTRVLTPNQSPSGRAQEAIGLSFNSPSQSTIAKTIQPSQAAGEQQPAIPQWIYEGGSNSLVARVIGSAEGTRTPSGQPTPAYQGHTDPGNGVWNMGTFSYQHGASSPEEADTKQLKRLQKQGKSLEQQAKQADLSMSLGEVLNGLDLANQSPRAALERGGYIDRLAQARQKGLNNDDAIVWARTYAYMDPDTQRWNAPGLGNTLPSIQRDQNRRYQAITQAFDHYLAQRETTGDAPADSLQTPALALAPLAPPPAPTPLQADEPPRTKQDPALFPAPTIDPVGFSVAEVSSQVSPPQQASPPQAEDSSQAKVVVPGVAEVSSQASPPQAEDSSQAKVAPGSDTSQIHS